MRGRKGIAGALGGSCRLGGRGRREGRGVGRRCRDVGRWSLDEMGDEKERRREERRRKKEEAAGWRAGGYGVDGGGCRVRVKGGSRLTQDCPPGSAGLVVRCVSVRPLGFQQV